jgi:hypothetical protein
MFPAAGCVTDVRYGVMMQIVTLFPGNAADACYKIVFGLAKDAHTGDDGILFLQLDQPRGTYE